MVASDSTGLTALWTVVAIILVLSIAVVSSQVITSTRLLDGFEDDDLSEYTLKETGGVVKTTNTTSSEGNISMVQDGDSATELEAQNNTNVSYEIKKQAFRTDFNITEEQVVSGGFEFYELRISDEVNGDRLEVACFPDTTGRGIQISGDVVDTRSTNDCAPGFDKWKELNITYQKTDGNITVNWGRDTAETNLTKAFEHPDKLQYRLKSQCNDAACSVKTYYDAVRVSDTRTSKIDVTVLDEDSGVLTNRAAVENATVETLQDGQLIDTAFTNSTGEASVNLSDPSRNHTLRVKYGGGVRFKENKNYDDGDNVEARIKLFDPDIDNASARPRGAVSPIIDGRSLNINVSDFDMPSENVTVEFYDYNSSATSIQDHDKIGSDLLQNDGTASVTWQAADDRQQRSWFALANDSQPFTENTTSKVFQFQQVSERPTINSVIPADGSVVNSRTQELQVFVSDADANDNLTAEFYEFETGDPAKDRLIGTDTTRANGFNTTWTIPSDEFIGQWYVRINDSYGNVQLSSVYRFGVSGNLIINDTANNTKITDRPVEVKFTLPGEQFIKETSNGTLPLPTKKIARDEDVEIRLRAAGYYESRYSLQNLIGNKTTYLDRCPTYSSPPNNPDQHNDCDPDNFSSRVVVKFTLQDNSGSFPPESTRLEIRTPINTSNDEKLVASSRFGAANSIVTSLEKDKQFSLRVINQDGEVRALGNIIADENETIPLTVGQLDFGARDPGTDGYIFNASWKEDSLGAEKIRVQFADPQNESNDITIEIYERGNSSNVLKTWQFARLGEFSGSVFVPPDQRNKTWTVELSADRGNGTINNKVVVGEGAIEPQIPLDQFWKQMVGIMAILMTAGLIGGGAQAEIGAIASCLVAGMFYLIGWLPSSTTGGMIVVALFISVAWRLKGPTPSGVR